MTAPVEIHCVLAPLQGRAFKLTIHKIFGPDWSAEQGDGADLCSFAQHDSQADVALLWAGATGGGAGS